ncbi:Serine/threonine-protein kinase PknF [Mycobacterium persicum]|uniref:Serine/threonine-protein kinase PknF n=1 Tax=Mycobacterium persicum TaxID=1487726 RepID=A0AB38USU0_9MYCO|nr:hypothetical protein A4G31_25940 [Mycobacterium persicum]VAZ75205.1 Serine/threonine-protein kinase PknF [Mycobacterium persicum]VAZ83699.1 Serine/threonine-protein kinase PknF [Mycobacterium persicum]VAZ93157.1 Serine/threonine-protein kinase PknF [Mycobacterium persicum]
MPTSAGQSEGLVKASCSPGTPSCAGSARAGWARCIWRSTPGLPRRDALKILPRELTGDLEFRQRFNREADLAASLYNEHIVGIHDRGEFQGHLWISMDYVEGTEAAHLLRSRYPAGMPHPDVVEIISADTDAMLAVATGGPAFSFPVPAAVTAGRVIDIEVIRRDRIEPAVFRREWTRAALAAANRLDVAAR